MEHEVVASAGHRDRVVLDGAEPAEEVEHCVGAALQRAAGASNWRATRNRRASWEVTFTRDATVRQEAAL